MKRNMGFVRQILMQIENIPLGSAVPPFALIAFSPQEVLYPTHLLTEDGLIEDAAVPPSKRRGPMRARGCLETSLLWKLQGW